MTLEELVEMRAIEQLKYRYVRLVDLKRFDELGEILTADATASYGGGAYEFEGRDAIIDFLRRTMGRETILTSHKVQHPELELESPTSARGVWALQDELIHTEYGVTIRGAAFYEDEYRKVDGQWRIAHTGYKRVYEELVPRPDGIALTASWWGTDGRSKLPPES